MRDNNEGYLEILDAYERGGIFFGVVRVRHLDHAVEFEFGVDKAGYRALRRVLQERPFEVTAAGPYKYFCGSVRGTDETDFCEMSVRIEQSTQGRAFLFRAPKGLVLNLRWFSELRDESEASHLHRVPLDRSP